MKETIKYLQSLSSRLEDLIKESEDVRRNFDGALLTMLKGEELGQGEETPETVDAVVGVGGEREKSEE